MSRLMNLLLVEDDPAELDRFLNAAELKYSNHITFIGKTDSSSDGIRLVRAHMPDGIILDLELHKGEGSGLEFLKGIEGADPKPIIFVTTNTPSNLVHNLVRDRGVDFIYYKRQKGYSPEAVISNILDLWKAQGGMDNFMAKDTVTKNKDIEEHHIRERIGDELDLIGIGMRYKGREYIEDAVFIFISKGKSISDSVFYHVANKAKVTYPSVIRSIQTAINKAWVSTKADDLSRHYTAPIDIRTGVPSPTEFIHYYADKLKKTL